MFSWALYHYNKQLLTAREMPYRKPTDSSNSAACIALQVVSQKNEMFYEPDHWRFGDPAGHDQAKNYPRHAQGLLVGLS